MEGTSKGPRGPRPVAVAGILAVAIGLLAPSPAAAASSQPTTEREQRGSHVARARLRSEPLQEADDLRAWVAMQRIVTPVGGGDLAVYPAPGSTEPSQVLPAVNELGSPLVLLTVTSLGDWYQVLLPTGPNGSTAWVPAGALNVAVPQFRVELSLSGLDLKVVSVADGAVVLTSPIGIGAPATPTPTGLFFVRDHFPTSGAGHPYGPFAFGLSGHSDVYTQFGTGDGRIAIHGTNQPSSIGAAASNGCPHVPNDVVLALIPYLPLGTPVLITA